MKSLYKIMRDRDLYIRAYLDCFVIWDKYSSIKITIQQNNETTGTFKIPNIKIDPFETITFDGEFLHLDDRKIKLEPAPDERFYDDIIYDNTPDVGLDSDSLKWLNRAISHSSGLKAHLEYLWIKPDCSIATDGHRLHSKKRNTTEKHPEYAIPRYIALEAVKLPFKKIKITQQKEAHKLRVDVICDKYIVEFWHRREVGKCPPYEQIVPKDTTENFTLEPKNFVKWLKKHKKITDGCQMTVKKDTISAVIQSSDVSVIEHFPLSDSTFSLWEPFIFMVNINYLIDTLDGTDTAVFSFEDRSNLNPVKIDIPTQKKTAVLMPMRF